MTERPMKLLIVGCGYVGAHVARQTMQRAPGTTVFALTRSHERVQELSNSGVQPIVGDWLDSDLQLPQVDHVLVAVPHRPVDDHGEATHLRGLQNVLAALKPPPAKLIYLSSTGVFGECENEVVDEDTPVTPTRIGPAIAVAAEKWLETSITSSSETPITDIETTVLRLAGIYGPNRIPLAAKLRAGEALAVPREGFLNLVHVDDIASVICEVFRTTMQRLQYVLSDGQPVIRETFYREMARLCGIELPQFCEPGESDTRAKRATNKRVNPTRIVSELNYQFKFPDYRSGLVDALGNPTAPA